MASIYKHRSSKWVAVIRHAGCHTQSKSFLKYTDAKQWAAKAERENQSFRKYGKQHTLHEAIDRYETEYVPSLKSIKTARWELSFLKRHIDDKRLDAFEPVDVVRYRDKRLRNHVSGSSVNRELNTLSRIFEVARKDWQWTTLNPVRLISRPKNGKHRERRPSQSELNGLRMECQRTKNQSIWNMIELAIETGMRQGELLALSKECVNLNARIAHLTDTKNGESRNVPLTTKACEILLSQMTHHHSDRIFPQWSSGDGFRSTFNRVCQRAGIINLRFHDFRHEAASRFFEIGLNQFQVAAITGHKSLQSLQRYTHIRAESLVDLLNEKKGYHL